MAVYLNECDAGVDAATIGFPHLLLCMGVVAQIGGRLYGLHFDSPSESATEAAALNTYIRSKGADPANGVRLYGCCNRAKRYGLKSSSAQKTAWKAEMTAIATALGYHGAVSGFDTGIIDPKQGTYVEYQADHAKRKCRIFYKRHEKMTHQTSIYGGGSPNTNVSHFSLGTGAFTGVKIAAESAQVIATTSNKGQIHEVNYALRLSSFTV